MQSFYGASAPTSSPSVLSGACSGAVFEKSYKILTDGENERVFVTDAHGFRQEVRPKAFVKGLASDSPAGLVSILTSDTRPKIQLPSNEHLRIKRLQKTVRVAAQVIQEHLQTRGVRFKTAMVTLTYRDGLPWDAKQVTAYVKCVREWARRRVSQSIMCGCLN